MKKRKRTVSPEAQEWADEVTKRLERRDAPPRDPAVAARLAELAAARETRTLTPEEWEWRQQHIQREFGMDYRPPGVGAWVDWGALQIAPTGPRKKAEDRELIARAREGIPGHPDAYFRNALAYAVLLAASTQPDRAIEQALKEKFGGLTHDQELKVLALEKMDERDRSAAARKKLSTRHNPE